MLKIPKYVKTHGKRRELSNVEKGMIIAFLVVYGTISTVSLILGRPWSTMKSFLQRYHKRVIQIIPHVLADQKFLPNAINELSYEESGRTGSIHASKSAGSTPPIFP